ncbi:MAG: Wzy polymerase domain-containing protein [Burkholderiaceae bacterium]
MAFTVFTLAWLLPNHYLPWVNFHSELLAFVAVGLLAVSLWRQSPGAVALPRVAVAAGLLALLPWLHYAMGLVFFAGDAWVASLYGLGFALAVCLGYAGQGSAKYADAPPVFLTIAAAVLAAALLSAAMAWMQWQGVAATLTTFVTHIEAGERAFANLGQPNQLGSLLLMGLVALAYFFQRGTFGKIGSSVATVFLTWALVLTESRTALLSAGALAVFAAYKHYQYRSASDSAAGSKHATFISPQAVVVWLLAYGATSVGLRLINRWFEIGAVRPTTLFEDNGRWLGVQQMWAAIKEAPWLGYGWNQTTAAQAVGAPQYPGELLLSNAHNLVLDVLVWVGLPLGVALSLALGYWLVTRLARVRSREAAYAMAMLLPLAVHSMLEFPYAYAYFLLTAGVLVGVVEAALDQHQPPQRLGQLPKRWAWASLAVLTALGSYLSYEYILIEDDFRVARFENLRVGRTPEDHVVPDVWMNTQLGALLATLRLQASPEMSAAQVERLRKVSLRFGYRPLVYRYALVLGLRGDAAGASRQMQVVKGMFGPRYYANVTLDLRRLQAEKYPQLAAVLTP